MPSINFSRKKLENVWYYHKKKILLSIAVIVIIIVGTIASYDNTPRADVTVLWMGQDKIPDVLVQKLNSELAASIKDVNNDGVKKIAFVTSDSPLKTFYILFSDDAQVVILDLNDFMYYTKNDTFRPIDDIVKNSSFNVDLNSEFRLTTNHDNTEHIYGIPLEGSKIFANLGLDMKSMYIARNDSGKATKMKENGLNIIKTLLQHK